VTSLIEPPDEIIKDDGDSQLAEKDNKETGQ